MKQYSHSALKVLGLAASVAISIHGSSALADAVAKPSTPMVGQMCETDAARLARAVFSPQTVPTLGGRAGCERPGVLAAPAQARFAALAPSTLLTTGRIAASALSPADAGALAPPLAPASGFAPADAATTFQPPARDIESAGLETYRSQGPISTFGQDDAPVGLKIGLRF